MKKNELQKAVIPICFLIALLISKINASEVCEWILNTCPEGINNQTITVPSNVIALSPNIRACPTVETFQSNDTPAIVFIIDDSRSMVAGMGIRGRGNDEDGTRFTVTRDLLDTLYQDQPGTWVGLVVFRAGLYFDKSTHDIFKLLENIPEDDSLKNQAYLPPLKLDSTYSLDDTEMRGIDIIKFFLKTETTDDGVRLAYQPNFDMESGTNINYGFDGALQGLKTIPESLVPLEQRYIIFLSDGAAQPYDFDPRGEWAFAEAEKTPTTFTVFLSENLQVPARLQEFTDNVSNNGYSESNPKSDIWVLRTSHDELMTLFMDNVIRPIMNKQNGLPRLMKINNMTSNKFTDKDSTFEFDGTFAIPKDTMLFALDITYRIVDDQTGKEFDSITHTSFTIVRTDKVNKPSEGIVNCWERDISLHYKGSPITAVNETMEKLEVVFTSDREYSNVTVQVTHTSGNNRDKFDLALKEGDSKWSEEFQRKVADPITSDKILQHQGADSIVLIFRNPDNPLDTIRKTYPFSINKRLSFPAAYYYDSNADGFVDSIFIEVEGALSSEDIATLKKQITLPSERNFKMDSLKVVKGGLVCFVTEGKKDIKNTKTYVTTSDVIVINSTTLPDGGLVSENIIYAKDRVAPVLMSGTLFSAGENDSLKVVFSEPVDKFSFSNPILFSTADGKAYFVELEKDGNLTKKTQYTAKVLTVTPGYSVAKGHLIWINPEAEISDTLDNVQRNPKNRKVPIDVNKRKIEVQVSVINNPLKPGDVIPEQVIKAFENAKKDGQIPGNINLPNNGMVIVVKPRGDIKTTIRIEADFSIYDVVKNPVKVMKSDAKVDLIQGFYDKQTQLYMSVWDGTNMWKRKVGTGTYTLLINYSIYDVNVVGQGVQEEVLNYKASTITRIGIKRNKE